MRAFIALPLCESEHEIKSKGEKTMSKLREIYHDEECILFDTFFCDYSKAADISPLKYLSRALYQLSDADIAVFADGWRNDEMCKILYDCVKTYGIAAIECHV